MILCGVQSRLEVSVQSLDLSRRGHLLHNLIRIFLLSSLTPALARENRFRAGDFDLLEIVENPLVELVTPMLESMRNFGIGLAESVTVMLAADGGR